MTVHDFLDPEPAQFTGDSLLERISRAYEEVVDEYGNACDQSAIYENVYLAKFALAWAHAVEDSVAATVRAKHCDNQSEVLEARLDFNRATAIEKRTKAKVAELQNRLVAAMAHQRFVREGT
jgi:hypothetical protein